MNTEKVKSKNSKLPILGVMVSCSWKCAILPVAALILFGAFKISVTTGFPPPIGSCVGHLGQKLGWWNNN